MIRINLLGGPKVVAVAAPEGAPGISPAAVAAAVLTLVVVGGASFFAWLMWTSQIKKLDQNIATAKVRVAQLQDIKRQADEYLQKMQQYQQRIDTIHNLQRSAVGPVELMRSVGYEADRANDLFLESISTQGDHLSVNGTSISITSLANFLGSLDKNGNFGDVTLRQAYEDDLFKRTAFKFALDCVFKGLSTAAEGAAPGQPGGPAGGRPVRPGM